MKTISNFLFIGFLVALCFPFNSFAQEEIDKTMVFTIVENMPTYPGCESEKLESDKQACSTEKIMAFLTENMEYPAEAKKAGVEGRVFVSYIIEKDGSITNVEVIKGIPNGELLNAEAIRVVKMLPKFNPGTQRGKLVPVRYNIPINFTL